MIHHEFIDLAGARNHARVEGYQKPPANGHDLIAATALVTTASVVIETLQKASGKK